MYRPLKFTNAHMKRYLESKLAGETSGWAKSADERINYLRGFKTLTEIGGFGRNSEDTNEFGYIKIPQLHFNKHEMGSYSVEGWLNELKRRAVYYAGSRHSFQGEKEAAKDLIKNIDSWLENPTR